LLGYPLGHSLSPRLHEAALAAAGLQGEYRRYPVPPIPQGERLLHKYMMAMRSGRLSGLNVTIPHKQSVLAMVDELTATAAAIQAVNTLFLHHDRLVGENTDAPGFLADLDSWLALTPGLALVLGAGGSARAVVSALTGRGWQVRLAARRLAQADQLIQDLRLPPHTARAIGLVDLPSILPAAPSLVVNTTPLGMSPAVSESPWPTELPFPPGAAIYDLVYNPAETRLIQRARRLGLPARSGLGMLIEQAALAFERWTGQPASRPAMRQAVADYLPVSL
jgi:shikimate dehydrogenase